MWSFMDALNAITNSLVYIRLIQLDPSDFINLELKTRLNTYMIVAIVVSWARFITFFLVI